MPLDLVSCMLRSLPQRINLGLNLARLSFGLHAGVQFQGCILSISLRTSDANSHTELCQFWQDIISTILCIFQVVSNKHFLNEKSSTYLVCLLSMTRGKRVTQ